MQASLTLHQVQVRGLFYLFSKVADALNLSIGRHFIVKNLGPNLGPTKI